MSPVSLVCLPASLTAPDRSGSTRPTRLRRGCSRPYRDPGLGFLQLHLAAATARRRGPFTPVRSDSASWRTSYVPGISQTSSTSSLTHVRPRVATPSLPRERRCPLAIELSVAAACRLPAAGSCHPGTATQPGMSMSRGISKGFPIVAPFRSFPSPVTAMAGAAVLGLFRELRTQPVRNRPRTSRRGQVEHKPVATSPASARPPRLAHSPHATSCRNNSHRPHRTLGQAAPLRPLPERITDLEQFRVGRHDRVGGVIHEYRLVA